MGSLDIVQPFSQFVLLLQELSVVWHHGIGPPGCFSCQVQPSSFISNGDIQRFFFQSLQQKVGAVVKALPQVLGVGGALVEDFGRGVLVLPKPAKRRELVDRGLGTDVPLLAAIHASHIEEVLKCGVLDEMLLIRITTIT